MIPAAGRSLWCGLLTALVACLVGWLPDIATASEAGKRPLPDLIPELPDMPTKENGNVPAVWIDPIEQPGRVLYRFDAAITNVGRGTLDVICDPCGRDSTIWQVLWPTGHPPRNPRPDQGPPARVPRLRISERGATMRYSPATGHVHWHLQRVARYELVIPGGERIRSSKVGFCLYDSFRLDRNQKPYFFGAPIPGTKYTWCATKNPDARFVRMGISPRLSDLYPGWLPSQWIDVTGLPPGAYRLRATIDPDERLVESRRDNNVIEVTRTIPGVRTEDELVTTTPATPLEVMLVGTVVEPAIPARVDPNCDGRTPDCYVYTSADGPLAFAIDERPRHGTPSTLRTVDGLRAAVVYTPEPGFAGQDSFSFQASDRRGLTSRETRVFIGVGEPARALDGRQPAGVYADRALLTADVEPATQSGLFRLVCRLTIS